MPHTEATRLILAAMREFYEKQGTPATPEMDIALHNLAEFVAMAVIRIKKR